MLRIAQNLTVFWFLGFQGGGNGVCELGGCKGMPTLVQGLRIYGFRLHLAVT